MHGARVPMEPVHVPREKKSRQHILQQRRGIAHERPLLRNDPCTAPLPRLQLPRAYFALPSATSMISRVSR